MKNVLVISSSLRNNSNSEVLARMAAKGANDAGNRTEFITLKDMDLRFCKGCLACQKTGNCIIKDDMAPVLEKVRNADVLIFASPIYYYGITGQLKTFLDRLNPLYVQEPKFEDVYLITTSAEDDEEVYERAVECLEGWIDCFPDSRFAGILSCGGIDIRKIEEDPEKKDLLKKAYELGKNV